MRQQQRSVSLRKAKVARVLRANHNYTIQSLTELLNVTKPTIHRVLRKEGAYSDDT